MSTKKTATATEVVTPKREVSETIIIVIDPKRTNGGIRVNGKRLVGKVKCKSQEEADDYLRIQEEYAASFAKLTDPTVKLRNQSIETSRKAFIVDPAEFGKHPNFTREFGMLDPYQWQFVPEGDRLEWQEERMGLFNY